jgi:uncharacterized protein YcbX
MAVLTQLLLYPIKSCAGMAVSTATLLDSGLTAEGVHDRVLKGNDQCTSTGSALDHLVDEASLQP